MKTSIFLKFFAAFFTSVIAFYAPIYATLLVVLLVITSRFIMDLLIVKRSKRSRGTKCEMYKDSGENFFKFLVAYLAILVLIYPTDIHLLAFFGSKHFIVTRFAALLIIVYEAIIINMRFKMLTGKSLSERAMESVKFLMKLKEIKNKLQE
jgi:hypothetical protein